MGKIIRLTESDLNRIVKRVINESSDSKDELWCVRRHDFIEELLNIALENMEEYGKVNIEDYIMLVIDEIVNIWSETEYLTDDMISQISKCVYDNFKEEIELDYYYKY